MSIVALAQGWFDVAFSAGIAPPSNAKAAGDYVFFQLINDYLKTGIAEFGIALLGRVMAWVGGIALTLMTLWIMVQGYRIATGQSRDSMMVLVTSSLRAALVVGLATGMALGGSTIYRFLGEDVSSEINYVVTGQDRNAYESIDQNLAYMQVAMGSIDALQVAGDPALDDAKTRALWFAGFGTGGPAMTAGAMLLLNKIAMALFIGLGPLFILCLLFPQTQPLFSRWLFYGIGTVFSLAVLSVLVALALKMVTAVAMSFWVRRMLLEGIPGAELSEGVTSMALQQGGLGLLLTVLIISGPPMAAAFFQGTLGQFYAFSQFERGGSVPPGAHGPGAPGSAPGQAGERSTPSEVSPQMVPASSMMGGRASGNVDVVRPAGTAAAAGLLRG